jgi:hypothetical protein
MGLLIQAVYAAIFKFFCVPVFVLMLIGRPRFLINWVHKFINAKEPLFKLRFFRFIFFLCCITVVWSYYRKYELEKLVAQIGSEGKTNMNVHFIDEKLREAHLFERNTYMFFTFIVIMIIVEKFCHSYFKLWALEDQVKNKSQLGIQKESTKELLKENTKEVAAEAGKDPLTKKSD